MIEFTFRRRRKYMIYKIVLFSALSSGGTENASAYKWPSYSQKSFHSTHKCPIDDICERNKALCTEVFLYLCRSLMETRMLCMLLLILSNIHSPLALSSLSLPAALVTSDFEWSSMAFIVSLAIY